MSTKKRITVDVPIAIYDELMAAHTHDGAGPSTRARFLMQLWHDNADVRTAVTDLLTAERLRAAEERS